jgi:hypothetical protein
MDWLISVCGTKADVFRLPTVDNYGLRLFGWVRAGICCLRDLGTFMYPGYENGTEPPARAGLPTIVEGPEPPVLKHGPRSVFTPRVEGC